MTRRLGEKTNRQVYVLSVLARIFLLLGVLAGLLGVNRGVLGTTSNWAFAAFFAGRLTVVGLAALWLSRRLRWL